MTTQMNVDTGYKLLASYKPIIGEGMVFVLESAGWRDYMVDVWVNGEHIAYLDYFTTDKADAIQHGRALAIYIASEQLEHA